MPFRKITAIIRQERLAKVEWALIDRGLSGVTVTSVKGFGEDVNLARGDLLVRHVRLEVFTAADHVEGIVETILETASTGAEGDGLVAVLPVEAVYRVRTRGPANAAEL